MPNNGLVWPYQKVFSRVIKHVSAQLERGDQTKPGTVSISSTQERKVNLTKREVENQWYPVDQIMNNNNTYINASLDINHSDSIQCAKYILYFA